MNTAFEDLARNAFKFLTDYGFHIIESDSGHVRFQSEKVYLEVLFDAQRSFEVGVQIGLVNELGAGQERPFSLPEILRLRRIQESCSLDGAQATTAIVLGDLLSALARNASDHARDFLAGDVNSYHELASFRDLETGRYAQEQRLRYMRVDADTAWAVKNYADVVKAYSSEPNQLSVAELKRLEFARKHIGKAPGQS